MEQNIIERYQQAKPGRQRDRLFAEIHAGHAGLVGNIAKGRPGDYGDLCQEGFLALHDAALTFDPSHGVTFYQYARQRIRWAVSKASRPAQRNGEREGFYDGAEPSRPAGQLDALVLAEALDRFTGRDRQVVEMLAAGFSGVEIAARFGISEQRASQIIARIRKGL